MKKNVTLHRIKKENSEPNAHNRQINNNLNNIYYFYEQHSFFFPKT